jgi:transcription elongation factor Elf1
MHGKERDEHEALCPRCGAEAEWSYVDAEKNRIAVMCSNCGRYEMPREEFDQALVENAELNETERRD